MAQSSASWGDCFRAARLRSTARLNSLARNADAIASVGLSRVWAKAALKESANMIPKANFFRTGIGIEIRENAYAELWIAPRAGRQPCDKLTAGAEAWMVFDAPRHIERGCGKTRPGYKIRPPGQKPTLISEAFEALKRRSSTVVHEIGRLTFSRKERQGRPSRRLRRFQISRRWPRCRRESGRPPGWEVRPGWESNRDRQALRRCPFSPLRRRPCWEPDRRRRGALFSAPR